MTEHAPTVSNHANPRSRMRIAAMALLVCGGIWVLLRFEPTPSSWYPKCLLHLSTGLHCPGCGATRACRAILQGDLWAAVRFNPLLVVGGPFIAAAWWWQQQRRRSGRPGSMLFTWSLAVILGLYFVARNVPSPATGWLAPP